MDYKHFEWLAQEAEEHLRKKKKGKMDYFEALIRVAYDVAVILLIIVGIIALIFVFAP